MEWISVKDRMPEDDLPEGSKQKRIKVLACVKGKKNTVKLICREKHTIYQKNPWEWTTYYDPLVTHWMPCPEPPKEE